MTRRRVATELAAILAASIASLALVTVAIPAEAQNGPLRPVQPGPVTGTPGAVATAAVEPVRAISAVTKPKATPTAQPALDDVDAWQPCAHEDGPGPCRWNAEEQGNGRGISFTITCDQRIRYDDPTDQARLAPPGDDRISGYPNAC